MHWPNKGNYQAAWLMRFNGSQGTMHPNKGAIVFLSRLFFTPCHFLCVCVFNLMPKWKIKYIFINHPKKSPVLFITNILILININCSHYNSWLAFACNYHNIQPHNWNCVNVNESRDKWFRFVHIYMQMHIMNMRCIERKLFCSHNRKY